MEEEIKKIKRTQLKILFTMSELLGYIKIEDPEKLPNKLKNISNEINYNDNELYNKISNLEMHNESLTNRIRMLEEDFERLKKTQLERYFEYSTEGTEEDENIFHIGYDSDCNNDKEECNNSDCSECVKDKYY